MKVRRVQPEAFLKIRSRALMRKGHDEVHLLAWGRHMETRSAAGPIAGGVMSSLPYSNQTSVSPTSSWCASATLVV